LVPPPNLRVYSVCLELLKTPETDMGSSEHLFLGQTAPKPQFLDASEEILSDLAPWFV
jgi:hypothetical protein